MLITPNLGLPYAEPTDFAIDYPEQVDAPRSLIIDKLFPRLALATISPATAGLAAGWTRVPFNIANVMPADTFAFVPDGGIQLLRESHLVITSSAVFRNGGIGNFYLGVSDAVSPPYRESSAITNTSDPTLSAVATVAHAAPQSVWYAWAMGPANYQIFDGTALTIVAYPKP